MRRTTQWAVFTTMNRQNGRVAIDSTDTAGAESDPNTQDSGPARTEPLARPAPDTRRDRVDLM